MQMYTRYSVRMVLDEYALVFFTLLNEGYRIQYGHYAMLARVTRMAQYKDSDYRRAVEELERSANGFDDILKPSEGSSPDEIKRLLG